MSPRQYDEARCEFCPPGEELNAHIFTEYRKKKIAACRKHALQALWGGFKEKEDDG